MRYVIILAILFVGCKQNATEGVSVTPTTPVNNAPTVALSTDFAPYVVTFKQKAVARNVTVDETTLSISYDPSLTGTNILGVCTRGGGRLPSITVNPTFWQAWATSSRSSEMEQLLYHEMGHCLLNRNHNDATVTTADNHSQIPISIMNSYHLSPSLYEINYAYYINELYNSTIAGTVAVYISGTSAFPTNTYASTLEPVSKYSIIASKVIDGNYVSNDQTIDQFACDDGN